MDKLLFKKINEYETIIIHRHLRADLDALGSQLGLCYTLRNRFPNKKIYAVGDASVKYSFIGNMDIIEDSEYKNALAIIVDVAVACMVSDERYKLAKEVFVIDHHKNDCDITKNHLCDTSKVAAAEYIVELLFKNNFIIPAEAATCFYGGIISDGGRFMYGNNLADTLLCASKLVNVGADYKFIYNNLYTETLEERLKKNYFSGKVEIIKNVAYLKNNQDVFDRFPCEFNDISRGMLSVMSGIKEIKIWLNFTYDVSKDKIIGEFRSRDISIVDIAKKYGGGGHELACGATIENWDVVNKVINDFVLLANKED